MNNQVRWRAAGLSNKGWGDWFIQIMVMAPYLRLIKSRSSCLQMTDLIEMNETCWSLFQSRKCKVNGKKQSRPVHSACRTAITNQ